MMSVFECQHDWYILAGLFFVSINSFLLLILGIISLVKQNNKIKDLSAGLIRFDKHALPLPIISLIYNTGLREGILLDYITNYITQCFADNKKFKIKPQKANSNRKITFGTLKGKVRSENQDFGLAFETEQFQLITIGDGCGGQPLGREAACIATTSASIYVLKKLCTRKKVKLFEAEKVVRESFNVASKNLEYVADILHINDGLRTTLIIALVLPQTYVWGYIGDGGLIILRSTGIEEHLLIPQKIDPNIPNILAASLGPNMQGAPIFGKTQRCPGDLLLCGTDGIFDRVPDSFPKDVMRPIIRHNGNLQEVIQLLLNELAEAKDELGYICDDNLTLGLIMDGKPPKLGQDFWKKHPDPALVKEVI